jgi:hypothetical protein
LFVEEVHSGTKEICKSFLGDKASENSIEHVDRLCQALREFLKACEDALALNKTLIGPDQFNFQTELEQGFADLKSFMERYLNSVQ